MKAKNREQLFVEVYPAPASQSWLFDRLTCVVCFRLWRRQNYRARTIVVRHRCARCGAAHCSRAGALFSSVGCVSLCRGSSERQGVSSFDIYEITRKRIKTYNFLLYVLYYQIIHPAVVSKSSGAHQAGPFSLLVVGKGFIFSWCGPWPWILPLQWAVTQVTMKRHYYYINDLVLLLVLWSCVDHWGHISYDVQYCFSCSDTPYSYVLGGVSIASRNRQKNPKRMRCKTSFSSQVLVELRSAPNFRDKTIVLRI